MLTAEIRINGKLLGHLYIINRGCASAAYEIGLVDTPTSMDDYLYDYEYFEVGSNKSPRTGKVAHKREDGALALIRICAEDVAQQCDEKNTAENAKRSSEETGTRYMPGWTA
jgi:hypothetical protein